MSELSKRLQRHQRALEAHHDVDTRAVNPKDRTPKVEGTIPMTNRKRWTIINVATAAGIIVTSPIWVEVVGPSDSNDCYTHHAEGCSDDATIVNHGPEASAPAPNTAPLPEDMGTSTTMHAGDRLSRVVCKDYVFIDKKKGIQIEDPVVAYSPSGEKTGLLPVTITPSQNAGNLQLGGATTPDPGTYEWRQPNGVTTYKVDYCAEKWVVAEQFGSPTKPQIALVEEGYQVYNDQPVESQLEGIAHRVTPLPQ